MRRVVHLDKKWVSRVTAYAEVTYDDGTHEYYVQGRYGGGPLTPTAYALSKPFQPDAWKRYRYHAGGEVVEVNVITSTDDVSGMRAL